MRPKGRIFLNSGIITSPVLSGKDFKAGQIGRLTMKRQLATTKPSIEISRKPFNPSRISILIVSGEKRTDRAYCGSITEE